MVSEMVIDLQLPLIGTPRHSNAHDRAMQQQPFTARHNRHPGDFRQHTLTHCPQQPSPVAAGQAVAWPKFSSATARQPARAHDEAPWNKEQGAPSHRTLPRRQVPDAAGIFTGSAINDAGTSKQVPDWMQQWELPQRPTPPPHKRQTGAQAARAFEGAAGQNSGVVLGDTAVSGGAPNWMHIQPVEAHTDAGGRGVDGHRQGAVLVSLSSNVNEASGWKTQFDLGSDAAGLKSGVPLGDSAVSGDAPSWMRIAEVDDLYNVSACALKEPVDNFANAAAKVPSGEVPHWMMIGGVQRSIIKPEQPSIRRSPRAATVKPWMQGARWPERRPSCQNRGAAARTMAAAEPPTVNDEDDTNGPVKCHATDRLSTPYETASEGLPAWAMARKIGGRGAASKSRALPFRSCHAQHGQVPLCSRVIQPR